jgi:hypothetical protein
MKLIIILLLIGVVTAAAQGQSETCVTNHNAPPVNAYYWPPDTAVQVYFERGKFTPEQRTALLAAMKTWSDSATQTGAGITFSFAGEIDELADCDGCLTITKRAVHKHDRKVYALFDPSKQDSGGQLLVARIELDFATTKPAAIQGFMLHELGHGMGLLDCKTCGEKETIMNGFSGINNSGSLIVPSPCDLEVVRDVYGLARRVNKNAVAVKE